MGGGGGAITVTDTGSVDSPPRPSETVSRKVSTTSLVNVGAVKVGETVVAPVSIGAHSSALIERSLGIVRQNLRTAESFFGGRPEQFEWLAPRAGSVAFPRWIGPGQVEAFCQAALDQAGVMIAPGSLFDYPGDHFRVGLGRKNFGEALEKLGEHLATNEDG